MEIGHAHRPPPIQSEMLTSTQPTICGALRARKAKGVPKQHPEGAFSERSQEGSPKVHRAVSFKELWSMLRHFIILLQFFFSHVLSFRFALSFVWVKRSKSFSACGGFGIKNLQKFKQFDEIYLKQLVAIKIKILKKCKQCPSEGSLKNNLRE